MATTIKLKNSVTTTNTPTSLAQGEVAINITDKKVWVGNAATTPIQLLGDGGSASFTSIAFGAGTVSNPSITFTGDTNTGIYSPAADTIAFTEGGVESMRIDSSGNVGIGTSSPATKLQISESGAGPTVTLNRLGDTSGNAVIRSTGSTGTINASITLGGGSDNLMTFATGSTASERMRIDSSGNVGIGTSSPAARFDITQANPTRGILQRIYNSTAGSSQTGAQVQFTQDSRADWVIGQPAATDAFAIWSGRNPSADGTERMRITSGGVVGIGSTSPVSDRALTLNSTSNYFGIAFQTSGTTRGQIIQESTGNIYVDAGSDGGSGALIFRTTGTERMRINSSGDVCFGTTSNSPTDIGARVVYNATTPQFSVAVSAASNNYLLYNTTAAAYRFFVTADGVINATNTTITAISDARLKENIQDIDAGLDKVMALKPRKFDWKTGKGKNIKGDRGWIAQEFEQVFPEMIHDWLDPAPEGEEPYKAVNADLIPVLVKAIQEQQAMIVAMQKEIAELKAK